MREKLKYQSVMDIKSVSFRLSSVRMATNVHLSVKTALNAAVIDLQESVREAMRGVI
jgi:hypothetical protein